MADLQHFLAIFYKKQVPGLSDRRYYRYIILTNRRKCV